MSDTLACISTIRPTLPIYQKSDDRVKGFVESLVITKRKLRNWLALALGLALLSGCATGAPPVSAPVQDPYEATNREIHAFNKAVDRALLKPASELYAAITLPEMRLMLGNAVANLGEPNAFVNHVLQGDVEGAGTNLLRFALNSTLGIAGISDPAAELGIFSRSTDFGETMGVWGVAEGPYVELPLLGPSTVRDAVGKLAPVGPGVERLGEEATALWPDARIATLSSDMYGSARALKAEIAAISEGAADIIIGTQLVAKGHNFPNLTLVGVIDADLGLMGSDLRAAERTFQLMRQVAGRAGRAEAPGTAVLQTYQPEHPVIRAILAGDEEAFWAAEAAERKQAGVPPYGRMAGIILSGPDVAQLFDAGNMLARQDGPLRAVGAQVFGPAPAPIARVRGRHRVRLLVKADKTAALQDALARWVAQLRLKGDLRIAVDIDPQSFY